MKKQQVKKYHSEKGAITLFVMVTMMFFLFILIGFYLSASEKLSKQNADIKEIVKNYEMDMEQIYNEKTKNTTAM